MLRLDFLNVIPKADWLLAILHSGASTNTLIYECNHYSPNLPVNIPFLFTSLRWEKQSKNRKVRIYAFFITWAQDMGPIQMVPSLHCFNAVNDFILFSFFECGEFICDHAYWFSSAIPDST